MPVPSLVPGLADLFVGWLAWVSLATFLLLGFAFHGFLLESLILAQDERWRRA
jgi:hypothetical protein